MGEKDGEKEKFSFGHFFGKKVKKVVFLRMDKWCSQRLRRGRIWFVRRRGCGSTFSKVATQRTAKIFSANSAILQSRASRTQWPNGPAMPTLRLALPEDNQALQMRGEIKDTKDFNDIKDALAHRNVQAGFGVQPRRLFTYSARCNSVYGCAPPQPLQLQYCILWENEI